MGNRLPAAVPRPVYRGDYGDGSGSSFGPDREKTGPKLSLLAARLVLEYVEGLAC